MTVSPRPQYCIRPKFIKKPTTTESQNKKTDGKTSLKTVEPNVDLVSVYRV